MKRIVLIQTKCERCGQPVTTTPKASLPVLCAGCATVAEVWAIARGVGQQRPEVRQ